MTRYVAFLRGIMPGNPNMRNAKLKEVSEKLGFSNVKTVISSGNVLFESNIKDSKRLEGIIENGLNEYLGLNTTTIIRSKDEIDELVKVNPFSNVSESKSEKPNVTFFKDRDGIDTNELPKEGRGFKGYGFSSNAYCYTVDMTSIKTPEAMITLEKLFGKGITTRTWGTVMKVHKLLNL